MKKIFLYAFVMLAGFVGMASCTEEYDYEPASVDDMGGNGSLSASEDGTAYMFTPDAEQLITFNVSRINADEAGDIALVSDNSKVTVPETVSFEAGEQTKTVTATCNVEVGGNESVTISVAAEDAFLYAQNALTFTIQVFPEISVTYIYALYASSYPEGLPVKLYDLGNGQYRLPAYGYDYDIDFTINAKNQIFVDPQPAWDHSNYGAVYVMGNASGDASADGSGNCYAGNYDPETGLATLILYHFVPDLGSFGNKTDYCLFPVE